MDSHTPPEIHTRADFDAAVLWALQNALARQSRRLLLADCDFADWPLGQPEVLEALQRWLRLPQRRLVLLAANYTEVRRRHPRFVVWRTDWAHAVEAWSPPAEMAALPSVMVDDGPLCLHRLAKTPLRASVALDAHAARAWREQLDAILQQSEAAFPLRTLGL